ncbi:MAG: 6,7-dimethyl-8-ribityllumazine synthase, partial [Sphingobacterium sp.]
MASSIKNLSDFSHIQVADASPFKFAIVVAQWNAEITGALLNGAISGLEKHGAKEGNIEVIEVPGSFELTSGADLALRNQSFDAVICL